MIHFFAKSQIRLFILSDEAHFCLIRKTADFRTSRNFMILKKTHTIWKKLHHGVPSMHDIMEPYLFENAQDDVTVKLLDNECHFLI